VGSRSRSPGILRGGLVSDKTCLSLTLPQLKNRLLKVGKSQPVGMTTVTVPDMRKKGNPYFGHVLKISELTAFVGFRYSKAVNAQRVREDKKPTFESLPRAWGERIYKTPVVEYGEDFYLELKLQARRSQIRDIHTHEIIPPDLISKYLTPIRKNKRQKLNREVVLRDYRLDHIAELRIDGQVWRVRKGWNLLQRLLGN
jgi:hypothetical protein